MRVGILAVLTVGQAGATSTQAPSLEDQVQWLNLPENRSPVSISTEKLYSVQSRFNPLQGRVELGLGVSRDFTNSGFLDSQQIQAGLRYHFNDRWSLGVFGGQVFNSLTETAQLLLSREGIVPDLAYARYRAGGEVALNTFYGKFRLTNDQVLYFDQYVAVGGGVVGLPSGAAPMATLDLGFAFWLGRSGLVRLGFKDHIYREERRLSSSITQHWLGHLEFGWMLGEGSKVADAGVIQ
jgi:outer membrane beta-barrel protein